MIKIMSLLSLFAVICFIVTGCGDPIDRHELNVYKAQNRYVDKQELITQTAFLVLEVDGKLRYDFQGNLEEEGGGYASGFLISRNNGLFKTAYHFTQHLGENGLNWCRLFLNGRVYRAGLYRALSNRDSAVIKIIDQFNDMDFPEPPPIATEKVKVEDKVSIEGYHPHPYHVRLRDQESGKKFQLIPLLKNYYQTVKVDKEDYTEIVYEILKGEVVETDKLSTEIKKENKIEEMNFEDQIQTYFEIRMEDDHFFSFGGLSGTVVKNEKGEVVGEVTMQQINKPENKIIYATPIEYVIGEIKDLVDNYRR